MNLADILTLKFPTADFFNEIVLQDDGEGVYIKEWKLPGVGKPTNAQLSIWATELEYTYQEKLAINQRQAAYPPIQDQLDMIYNDKINNTSTWVDAIAAVKTAYPKPTEEIKAVK